MSYEKYLDKYIENIEFRFLLLYNLRHNFLSLMPPNQLTTLLGALGRLGVLLDTATIESSNNHLKLILISYMKNFTVDDIEKYPRPGTINNLISVLIAYAKKNPQLIVSKNDDNLVQEILTDWKDDNIHEKYREILFGKIKASEFVSKTNLDIGSLKYMLLCQGRKEKAVYEDEILFYDDMKNKGEHTLYVDIRLETGPDSISDLTQKNAVIYYNKKEIPREQFEIITGKGCGWKGGHVFYNLDDTDKGTSLNDTVFENLHNYLSRDGIVQIHWKGGEETLENFQNMYINSDVVSKLFEKPTTQNHSIFFKKRQQVAGSCINYHKKYLKYKTKYIKINEKNT